jgi:hypothetical protein
MCATNQKMKMHFIQNLLSFVINVDLFNATNGILVVNVDCNKKLVAKTSHILSLFF